MLLWIKPSKIKNLKRKPPKAETFGDVTQIISDLQGPSSSYTDSNVFRRFFHETISSCSKQGGLKSSLRNPVTFQRCSFPEILWLSWPSQPQDFHIPPHTVAWQQNKRTGQSWQCPPCPPQPLSQLSCKITAQLLGYFQAQHPSSIQPFPLAALLETHPTPQLTANPKWPLGDLSAPLGALQHTKGSAHSLPVSLMQIKMVPKFQPVSNHVIYFQKEKQYLGYCSAKNLN